jgi:RHS repeat-associated protein
LRPGEKLYYFINDHLGTPQVMIDEFNQVVWEADYTPFGVAAITTSALDNNFRFPGQYFDSETGLHYNYHRYYDPEIGRYITADPIGIVKGMNHLFVYAQNNPLTFIDTKGLLCIKLGCLPTRFSLSKLTERKDITDWVLKGANGFGFNWEKMTIGGILCRWKKEVQIKDTYTLTTYKICFKYCLNECKNELVTYCDDSQSTYERTHIETLQKDYEGAWGMSINWPQGNAWNQILDVATITNQERQKCSQMRAGEGF